MPTNSLTPIDPVKPIAPYIGGKIKLQKTITRILDHVPHTTYAEPFVGMGGIFLRRKTRPKAEVINDYSRDVSNLFRILQRHYPQFLEVMRFQITTRTEFERLIKTDPSTLTDLERAARFLYLQKTAFGGKVRSRAFGVSVDRPGRFNLSTLEPMLEDLHARLSAVVIECLDYAAFIRRYDGKGTLFYLDPPYWGCENDYGKNVFDRGDFAKIQTELQNIKGRFVMSFNDVGPIRDMFTAFQMKSVSTQYSIKIDRKTRKERPELLISNFPIDLP
ncbi:MAG: DNA adenine methylase [Planktomarina sp.]